MQRIALFSDVHGNYYALKAVLEKIKHLSSEERIDRIYCLGDILFGHAGGSMVVDLLDEYGVQMIRGNHDQFDIPRGRLNPSQYFFTQETQEWLEQNVDLSILRRLNDLPVTEELILEDGRSMCLFHSNPNDLWDKVNGTDAHSDDLMRVFGQSQADVIAYGHYHQGHVMTFNGKVLINVASVDSVMSGELGALARFTLLTSHPDRLFIHPYTVTYDVYAQNLMNRDKMAPIFMEQMDNFNLLRC